MNRLENTYWMPAAALLAALLLTGRAAAADIDAVLEWPEIHVASFPFDGGVSAVHVRAGDRVGKGDRLIELNSEPIAINVSRYEAEVRAHEPVLADAKREFEQARTLYEQTVLSDVELDKARLAFEKAGAEMAASRARLQYARWQLKVAVATAPWDGWVIARDVEPGQMLVAEQRSRSLLTLARAGVMSARTDMTAQELRSLTPGQAVSVLVGDRSHAATITSLGLQPVTAAGEPRYAVRAQFSHEGDDPLRAGQRVKIRLR